MKKTGLLNAPLSAVIASMGHTQCLTIADAGLPIPDTVERIDLAVSAGIPRFVEVLRATVEELFVEKVVMAIDIKEKNPAIHSAILDILASLEVKQKNQIIIEYLAHEQFKAQSQSSMAIVRSGECSPYANIILYSGVPF